MGSRFSAAAAVTIVAWLLTASPARAEDATTSAAQHAKQAMVAYDLQDYKTAIAEYQAAFRADQRPDYLWGLAQAQRQSGDCTAAIKTFKAFGRVATTEKQATAAGIQISKCEVELAKSEKPATAPPKTETPTTAPPPETPTSNGATAPASQASGSAQGTTVFTEAPLPPPTPWYRDAFGHVLVITGLASVGTGVGFLVKSGSDAGGSFDQTLSRVIGVGGLVVGGTLVIDGIIRYLLVGHGSGAGSATGVRISPTIGPRDAQLSISGRF